MANYGYLDRDADRELEDYVLRNFMSIKLSGVNPKREALDFLLSKKLNIQVSEASSLNQAILDASNDPIEYLRILSNKAQK